MLNNHIAIYMETREKHGETGEMFMGVFTPPDDKAYNLDDIYHNEFLERFSNPKLAQWQRIYIENYAYVLARLKEVGYPINPYRDAIEEVEFQFVNYLHWEHGFVRGVDPHRFAVARVPKNWEELRTTKEGDKSTYDEWASGLVRKYDTCNDQHP